VTLIVDTSVVVKWFVAEEGQDAAEKLIGTAVTAPDLLLVEVSNAVWKKWRKQELDIDQAALSIALVHSFVQMVPAAPFAHDALQIAMELEHPVYDCFNLAMCQSTARVMVTADARLIGKCAGTRFEPMLRILA
jgi:predicted nucleic acid-binding protein